MSGSYTLNILRAAYWVNYSRARPSESEYVGASVGVPPESPQSPPN